MKTIKLLLTENVDNLGIVGDVVNVKAGYARNYLLPRGLAGEPTEGNIARLAERRAIVEAEMLELRKQTEAMFAKIQDYEITLQRSHNEQGILFGGVSQHDIAEQLRADGFDIDDRVVRIGQTIKRLDSYDIPVVLAQDLKTEIKLWVVSDRPAEELEAEERESGQSRESAGADDEELVAAEADED